MARPGVEVIDREVSRPRSAPTDTGVWFVAGMTDKGSTTGPVEINSMDAYTRYLGARVSYGFLYDALETYFREGGGRAYVARVVGPTPVSATLNVTATGTTHTITAKNAGAWANGATGGITVDYVNGPTGSTTRVYVIKFNGVEIERTPEFDASNRTIPVDWSAFSEYVTIALGGGSGLPTVAAANNLASGTDDRANATDTQWAGALARFAATLGPGQVSQPGRTTTQAYTDTMAHAEANNRVAILDAPDTSTVSTLLASGASARALNGARVSALFAPWVVIRGTSTSTTRTIPPSAVVTGRMANTDRVAGPNQPAAGDYGISLTALSLTQTYLDDDAETLNEGSVNLIRDINGQLTIYGYRTAVDKTLDPKWWMLSNSRLAMFIRASVRAIGQRYNFRQIDGLGHTLTAFGGAVDGFMQRLYQTGQIYPDPNDQRAETAYSLSMGPEVNTPDALADGILAVDVAYRPSPFAELVRIGVTVVPFTDSVS